MNEFRYASRKYIKCEKIVAFFIRKAFAEIGYREVWYVDRYFVVSPLCVVGGKLREFLSAGNEYYQNCSALFFGKIALEGCGEYAIGQYLVGIIERKNVAGALGEFIDIEKHVLPRIHRERGEVVLIHIFLQSVSKQTQRHRLIKTCKREIEMRMLL